ncbi:SRPBCC family protein [Thalassomonas sp. RHCl1]|uniref:SRPBCC family protein n=1 Tax=Thalassomonas sp. RHCl1 TaxID=2995320 RepID=UPI00248CBF56|nr:SRPBCC family protein [Thalassomonas sp. RHCl1]
MQIINKININAPVDTLWKILADDYNDICQWTSVVNSSTENPELSPGEGRACELPDGAVAKETLTRMDKAQHTFSYQVELSGMPFFVRSMENTWRVEKYGQNQSRVTFEIHVALLPVFAQLMGPLMKSKFNKLASVVFEELKFYAETGKVHPRKHELLSANVGRVA